MKIKMATRFIYYNAISYYGIKLRKSSTSIIEWPKLSLIVYIDDYAMKRRSHTK